MSERDRTTTGQEWATHIRRCASDDEVMAMIHAINSVTRSHHANRAAVIVACAQVLGQNISASGGEIAAEMRAGIVAMIEGYTMQSAVEA